MIEKLTEKHEAILSVYRDKWLKIGLSTEPIADKNKVVEVLQDVYRAGGLEPPSEILFFDSPMAVLKHDSDVRMSSFIYGSHDASWLSYYDFFINEMPEVTGLDKVKPLIELSKIAGWVAAFDTVAYVCERPTTTTLMNQQLHNDYGPAIQYKDGESTIFALRGVVMPEWVVMTPPEKLDATKVLQLENVDQRREAMRKIGLDRLYEVLNKQSIDRASLDIGGDYELITMDLTDDITGKFLVMHNPSIDAVHVEGVPDDCATVMDALKFRNGNILAKLGVKKWQGPETLT